MLAAHGIDPLQLDPKEGLALVNGDNFSTAMASHIFATVSEYYLIAAVVGAMTIEVLEGSNRSFHPLLSRIRPHAGQQEVADVYRFLLNGSKLAHQELTGHKLRPAGVKVQDGYSLRCLPQFEGVMLETLSRAESVLTINANSTSDNPVWVPEADVTAGETPWQWVSGGNFLAMHVAEVMDQLRKVITQLIKRNDRHLARLIDVHENNGLPANLSDSKSVTQCSFKGVQIESGMFDVYSMILAQPVTTLFGVHEERNQDITSHALTSGILALTNLDLLSYSLAINLLAVTQAVDLRGGKAGLSPRTQPVYDWVRSLTDYVDLERPLAADIQSLATAITSGDCIRLLLNQVYSDYDQ
jgi:histidine ammonia-lyase